MPSTPARWRLLHLVFLSLYLLCHFCFWRNCLMELSPSVQSWKLFEGIVTRRPILEGWAPVKCKIFAWPAANNPCQTADKLGRHMLQNLCSLVRFVPGLKSLQSITQLPDDFAGMFEEAATWDGPNMIKSHILKQPHNFFFFWNGGKRFASPIK